MKILLTAINAKYIHSNLAVYSLQAYARAYRSHLELAEFTINQKKEEILKGIFRRKPEVLCISCYIWNRSLVKELTRELHKILPDTDIWLGGPEVSFDAAQVLDEWKEITGVMKGEGEGTFLELVEYYVNQLPESHLDMIAGITFRRKGSASSEEIRDNGWRKALKLDEVPFVYEDLFRCEKQLRFDHRILYYESSRGCPFSCSYCLSSVDKQLRFRSLELVEKELQFFLDHRVPQVKFVDRTFNCRPDRAYAIWKYLTEHDNGVTNFHFEIAADLLTEKEITLIRGMRPGMIQLEIGIQSANPATIKEIRRKMDLSLVAEAVEKIRRGNNVHQHLDLIAGLPYEGYDSFADSFNQVYRMRPQQLQLGFLKVLKGSYMHEKAEEYGCRYQDGEPYEVLFTRWLSYEELLKIKLVEEMVEVYYNSSQFTKILPAAQALFSSPFAFFQTLGEFYEARGYLGVSHTRLRRYEILLEFLMEYAPQNRLLYQEFMIYDLYSRENLKSRPSWASSLDPYRQEIRRFYEQEAEKGQVLTAYQGYDEKQLARMTHIEILHVHPDTQKPGKYAYLFDYRERDPLTSNARCVEVTAQILPPRSDGD